MTRSLLWDYHVSSAGSWFTLTNSLTAVTLLISLLAAQPRYTDSMNFHQQPSTPVQETNRDTEKSIIVANGKVYMFKGMP